MKYADLQKNTKKLAKIWSKYKQKKNWELLLKKNKKKVVKKINTLKKDSPLYQKQKEKINEILPSKKQLRIEREKLLYLITMRLEKAPVKWASTVGIYTGKFFYRFHRGRRNLAIKQIKYAFPHWTSEKIAQVAEDSFENIGEVIFETLKKADYGKNIEEYVKIKNLEVVKDIKKTGAILVSGHFANWEFGTFALEAAGLRGIILGNEQSLFAKNLIARYRKAIGWQAVSTKSKLLGTKILKAIKQKEMIHTMLDTDPLKTKTVLCDFFDRKTNVSSFPARIAKKYNLPVVAFFNYRTKDKKHIFSFEFLSKPPYNEKQTAEELSQIYTHAIEKHIRKYPTQWRWAISRWKKKF
jgi:KDO2-lipid IV(A) lauroyltransferase